MLNKSDINKKISFKVSYRLSSTKSKPGRNIIICVLNVSNKTINAIKLINIINNLFKNETFGIFFFIAISFFVFSASTIISSVFLGISCILSSIDILSIGSSFYFISTSF